MARVSTSEQAENGYSIPTQLEACRRYANKHGFEVAEEVTDDCSGAIPVADRPGGARVYELLKAGQVDAVIQYTIDRTARDKRQFPLEYFVFLSDIHDAGAELHFVDTGKSDGGIVDMFKAWKAADERRDIRERTMRGREAKAKSGLVVSPSLAPFGYSYHEGEITPNEDAPIVEAIYSWYVHGDEDTPPLSINGIAKRLTQMGVTTPGSKKGYKPRAGSKPHWNTKTVYDILSNETYIGTWKWGQCRRRDGVLDTNPHEAVISVSVPGIVSREMWEAAQERREYNKRMSRRNTRRKYLLRGMVRCECGYVMIGHNGGGRLYYRCNGQYILRFGERPTHPNKYIRCELLDAIVWDYVLDLTTNPETFRNLLLEAQRQELNALQPKRERLAMVKGLISQAESEAGKFAQALKNASGGIVGETLQNQIHDLNTRHATLCAERDTLTAEIEAGVLSDAQITEMLATFNQDVITGLRNATFGDKRRALEDLRVQVYVKDGQARVTCRIPVPDGVFALTHSRMG